MKIGEFFKHLKRHTCLDCNSPLSPDHAESYDHKDGWSVEGFSKKQWVYLKCGGCKYENAISKLGYPREEK